jgi:hypothetical protein
MEVSVMPAPYLDPADLTVLLAEANRHDVRCVVGRFKDEGAHLLKLQEAENYGRRHLVPISPLRESVREGGCTQDG